MKEVFIIGSKGIPAKYGGFETFVENLTRMKTCKKINYHVSCMAEDNVEFYHNQVRCFNVKVPNIGSAKAILYDILSIKECIKYIKEKGINNAVIYVLACRIGPFFGGYKKELEKLGAKVFVNPDGHEWKRSKWNFYIRQYWKVSERLMVKHADLLVCDSKGIEKYIQKDYANFNPRTTFIAYGASVGESKLDDDSSRLSDWYQKHSVSLNEYYLIVGRFVSENNYELMIREFMASNSTKDLVIISNVEHNNFYKELLARTNFKSDPRIKFVGTVYDQELLQKIREKAYGYFHGHEVGGTNPSLLEALATTKLNILLDVVFNKEVAAGNAIYFTKETGNLASVINEADSINIDKMEELSTKAKHRIKEEYSWEKIVNEYETLFLNE
ncbi:beta 1-4 rhamnosyltransferase Cps2T [Rossellomorea sp. LjRoot5]|uniref:beta 1-4 rhamnosyltransferase Cps2T n=1 Tax=Rossellomorea sp. LjRoot5 TaxID=3342331 RepID=UPI003ECEE6AF